MADFIDLRGRSLWDVPATVRVIPVNTVGSMGAGLAKEAAERVPGLLKAYKEECKNGFDIGSVFPYTHPEVDEIYLCVPTKRDWRDYTKTEYINSGLAALADQLVAITSVLGIHQSGAALRYPIITVSLPPIGSGLGNVSRRSGNKQERIEITADAVRTMIRHHLIEIRNITVFLY